jgi:integrase
LVIEKNAIQPALLEKTFITLCRSYGMDSSVFAELVGHAHESTADKFYNRIDHKLMIKELKKFKFNLKKIDTSTK